MEGQVTTKTVTVDGLHLIEYLELEELVGLDFIRRRADEDGQTASFGEPTLIAAVIILTAATVRAVSDWLNRRHADRNSQRIVRVREESDGQLVIEIGDWSEPGFPTADTSRRSSADDVRERLTRAIEEFNN
jgi:hypothetical protein